MAKRHLGALSAAAVAAMLLPGATYAAPSTEAIEGGQRFDVLLSDGLVVDGSGDDAYVADVGVRGGRIAAVGDLDSDDAATTIDVEGLAVSPGFVDNHSHATDAGLEHAKSALYQGVTTEMLSPDGGGPSDIDDRLAVADGGIGINVGAYVPFNAVWRDVVGEDDRRATAEEIAQMRELIDEGMTDGAWGVSAGLAYTPATFADTDQVIEVVDAARDWRTNFANHIRNETDQVIEATEETITIGESSGVAPVVTHMKVMGANNWGKTEQTLGLIDQANERGVFAAADVYPYLRSQTSLTATVPEWIMDGGTDAMLARFADPELRSQIAEEIEAKLVTRVEGPEGVWINDAGMTLQQWAEQLGVSTGEAVMRYLEEEGNSSCIWTFGNEEDLRRIMTHPMASIASDGGASIDPTTHPRKYGTQPRVLGKYVREEGVLSLEEAVKKMTSQPAATIGMTDRGLIEPGMAADITVFDPETVIDRGTYEEPAQYADGIEHVLIGGEFALQDGEVTGAQLGEALRRDPGMPSRPVTDAEKAGVTAAGKVDGATVAFRAKANDGDAKGTLTVTDGDRVFRSEELGRLQVSDGWASITGRGQLNGSERTFVLTVDDNDPELEGTAVTVDFEGEGPIRGVLTGKAVIN